MADTQSLPTKQDGSLDMRYKASREAEKQGVDVNNPQDADVETTGNNSNSGSTEGETYKPKEHGGMKKDGQPDKRTNPEHGFGGDRERASEMGKKGGSVTDADKDEE